MSEGGEAGGAPPETAAGRCKDDGNSDDVLSHGDNTIIPFAPAGAAASPTPPRAVTSDAASDAGPLPDTGALSSRSGLSAFHSHEDDASRHGPLSPLPVDVDDSCSEGAASPIPPKCLDAFEEATTATTITNADLPADNAAPASPQMIAGSPTSTVRTDDDAACDSDGNSASLYDEDGDEEVGGEVAGHLMSQFQFTISKAVPDDIVGLQVSDTFVVTHIEPGTPAFAAGLEPGMQITSIGLDPVGTVEELRAALASRVTVQLGVAASQTPSTSPSPRDGKKGMASASKAFSDKAASNKGMGTLGKLKGIGGMGGLMGRGKREKEKDAAPPGGETGSPQQGGAGKAFAGKMMQFKKKAGGMLGDVNIGALGKDISSALGDLKQLAPGHTRTAQELMPVQGKTGENVVVVPTEGFLRAKKDIVVWERRRVELAESRRRAETDAQKYQTETQENQGVTDKLSFEYRKVADLIERSRDPEGVAQLEEKIRLQDERKESDLRAFIATQQKLKEDLKKMKQATAALRERVDAQGIDSEAAAQEEKASVSIDELIATRQEELAGVDNALARLDKQQKALDQAILLIESEQEALADEVNNSGERHEALENGNTKLRQQREQLQKALQADAAKHEKTVADLEATLDAAEGKAEEEFDGARQALNQNQEWRKVLTERLEQAEANFENLKKSNKQLQREVDDRRGKRQDEEARYRDLVERAARLQENKANYEQTEAELAVAEGKLESERDATRRKLQEQRQVEHDVRASEKDVEDQSRTLLACEEAVKEREAALAELQETLRDLEILESHLPQLEEQYSEEHSKYTTERSVNLNLMRMLASLEADKEKLLAEIADGEKEADELETKSTALRRESDAHLDLLESMITAHYDNLAERQNLYAEKRAGRAAEVQALCRALADADESAQRHQDVVARFDAHLASARPKAYVRILQETEDLPRAIYDMEQQLAIAKDRKREAYDRLKENLKKEKKKDLLMAKFAVEDERDGGSGESGGEKVWRSLKKKLKTQAKVSPSVVEPWREDWRQLEELLYEHHAIREENKHLQEDLRNTVPV